MIFKVVEYWTMLMWAHQERKWPMFEYQGLHHTWVEGFFWSFLLLQDIFPSKVTPSFKSSKTNILKSQLILKIPRLFIVTDLNLLHVTNQNEDQVVTNGRWLIMTVETWGFFCELRSMQFLVYFHLVTEYSSNYSE